MFPFVHTFEAESPSILSDHCAVNFSFVFKRSGVLNCDPHFSVESESQADSFNLNNNTIGLKYKISNMGLWTFFVSKLAEANFKDR